MVVVVEEEEEVVETVVEVVVMPSIEMVYRAMCRPSSLVRDIVTTSAALHGSKLYECLHILLQHDLNTQVMEKI